MKNFKQHMIEAEWRPIKIPELTQAQLDGVEEYADKLFQHLNLDIEFTKHFKERVNDIRNKKQITEDELKALFTKAHSKYGLKISKMNAGAEAVLNDMKTDINMPFAINWNSKRELEFAAKTVMRKKGFKTKDKTYNLETYNGIPS